MNFKNTAIMFAYAAGIVVLPFAFEHVINTIRDFKHNKKLVKSQMEIECYVNARDIVIARVRKGEFNNMSLGSIHKAIVEEYQFQLITAQYE